MSIATVQARMAELQSAISAVSRPAAVQPAATSTSAPQTDFGGAMATALADESALSALTGQTGPSSNVGLAGQSAGLTGQSAGLTGQSAGLTGQIAGLVGQSAGLVGQIAGLAGQSAGLIGQIAGLVGQSAGLTGTTSTTGTTGPTSGASATGATSAASDKAAPTGAAAATGSGAATSSGSPAPGTGAAFVEAAKKYLGVPYVWGGEKLSEGGLDCSGLVQLAMSDIGVSVPRVAREQMKIGTEVPSLDQALPGDLIVTRGGAHIGIYVGENKWIHAPYPGEVVKLAEMTSTPTTIRRVLPTTGA